MAYTIDPTNPAAPADTDPAASGAGEFRALKGYIQGLITGGSSFSSYAWQGFRNKLINGNFDKWRWATSLAAGTGTRYAADCWFVNSSGTTLAVGQGAFPAQDSIVPYAPTYYYSITAASVAGASNFGIFTQRIESVKTLAGVPACISFWARCNTGTKSVTVELVQAFGTGGSPSGGVTGILAQKITLTTTFQQFIIPVTPPSISGKTLGTNGDDYLEFNVWLDAGSTFNSRTNTLGQQSGTFDFSEIQFEPGGIGTPFELLPPAITLELCQRRAAIFESSAGGGGSIGSCYVNSATSAIAMIPFETQLRRVPTAFAGIAGNQLVISSAAGAINSTSIVYNPNTSPDMGVAAIGVAGGLTAGQAGLVSFNAAGIKFIWPAEL